MPEQKYVAIAHRSAEWPDSMESWTTLHEVRPDETVADIMGRLNDPNRFRYHLDYIEIHTTESAPEVDDE